MRKAIIFVVAGFFLVSLAGCASTAKQKDMEIQGLKNQVSVLESQVQSKDEEINRLNDQLSKTTQEPAQEKTGKPCKKRIIGEVKSRPNTKQIQLALRNAGFEPGSISGRMDAQTKEAIKSFQKANNLSADGKVGKKTWAVLKSYLYQKTK